jgi:hypothetical protein
MYALVDAGSLLVILDVNYLKKSFTTKSSFNASKSKSPIGLIGSVSIYVFVVCLQCASIPIVCH